MSVWMQMFVVGLGGFVGAISRFALTGLVRRWFPGFLPMGTLVVNVLGCFLIGVLMAWVVDVSRESRHAPLSELYRLLLVTGLLGSLTTFSAFGYETVELLRQERWWAAIFCVAGNLVLGLTAVVAGRGLVRSLWI